MPVGTLLPMPRPAQVEPRDVLRLDHSYYMVSLDSLQAYFEMGLLAQPAALLVSSEVTTSFSEKPFTSLHQIAMVEKGMVCRLPLNTLLTNWLPARQQDTFSLRIRFTILRDAYFSKLVNVMQQVKLTALASLVSAELAVAAKASEIAGGILSYLLREGQAEDLFEMSCARPLTELQAGYYLIMGSRDDRRWPNPKDLSWSGGQLRGPSHLLDKLCLAGMMVRASPVRGWEAARTEGWYQWLSSARDEVLALPVHNRPERQQAQETWLKLLRQVKAQALKQNHWLLDEIEAIIRQADVQVQEYINGGVHRQTTDILPEEWQKILGVSSPAEEANRVLQYQNQMQAAQAWRGQFSS